MGRRPRRNQHERCRTPPDAKKSGMATAWLVVFLVTVWEGAAPSLCPATKPPKAPLVDCEPWHAPTVPAEALVDAGWGGGVVLAAFPPPGPLQHTPTCPTGTVERNGGCWRRTEGKPPCQFFEVQEGDACYMAVPVRPKGRPVAGGE